jgi:hypothetical protein
MPLLQNRPRQVGIQIPRLTIDQNLIAWSDTDPSLSQNVCHPSALSAYLFASPIGLNDNRAR